MFQKWYDADVFELSNYALMKKLATVWAIFEKLGVF
jgi:hypothetical protein